MKSGFRVKRGITDGGHVLTRAVPRGPALYPEYPGIASPETSVVLISPGGFLRNSTWVYSHLSRVFLSPVFLDTYVAHEGYLLFLFRRVILGR